MSMKQIDFETFKKLRTGGMSCNCKILQRDLCLLYGQIPESCPIWNSLPDVPYTEPLTHDGTNVCFAEKPDSSKPIKDEPNWLNYEGY